MKKSVLVLAGIFLSLAMMKGAAYAEDKLAYIDLSRAFSEYHKTKDYDKNLTDKENNYISERDKSLTP